MNLMFYFALLITSLMCTENNNSAGKTIKKVEKSIFKLKIMEDEKNYVITLRSKYYFPIYATWYSGDNPIDSDFFYVENIEVFDWIKDNITDANFLDKILNNLEQHFFVFKSNMHKFYKKKKKLNCSLDLLKKEDFRAILTKYWNNISLINPHNTSEKIDFNDEIYTEISSKFKSFGIVYSNITEEILDLNDLK